MLRLIEFISAGFDFVDRHLNPVAWQDQATKVLIAESEPRHAQFWRDAARDRPGEVEDWKMQSAHYVEMWQSRAVRDAHNRVVAVRPMTVAQQRFFDNLAPEVRGLIADSPFNDSFHYRAGQMAQMQASPR